MTTPTQLGSFSKLPCEIRLMIWKELFSGIKSTPKLQEQPSVNPASILSCSKYFNEEVSSYLYHDLKHSIHIDSQYHQDYYVKAMVSSSKVLRVWKLKDSAALKSHLLSFPHSKIESKTLIITIWHLSDSLGRVINLWLKVNDLVNTLRNFNLSVKLHLRLGEEWPMTRQDPYRSFRRFGANNNLYDYDLAFVPFTRLSNWSYELSNVVITRLREESTKRPHSVLYSIQKHKQKACSSYSFTDAWIVRARRTLDCALDTAIGVTAGFLRRDRFMNWFSADGSSAYEQQFLQDLEKKPKIISHLNKEYWRIVSRRSMLLRLYGVLSSTKVGEVESRFRIWEPEEWLSKYPKGMDRLKLLEPWGVVPRESDVSEISSLVEPALGKFSEDLRWWSTSAELLFSETEYPCAFFNCSLCLKHNTPCRWCKKYDYYKRCGFCREGMTERTIFLYLDNHWHESYCESSTD